MRKLVESDTCNGCLTTSHLACFCENHHQSTVGDFICKMEHPLAFAQFDTVLLLKIPYK